MVKKKVKKKEEEKPAIQQFTFSCPEGIKNSFVKCCSANESSAARELRLFMKKYLQKHGQGDLFK